MLVLTRRENEEIVIPGLDVKIKIIKVQGSRAKLGVEAPQEVRVIRANQQDDEQSANNSTVSSR